MHSYTVLTLVATCTYGTARAALGRKRSYLVLSNEQQLFRSFHSFCSALVAKWLKQLTANGKVAGSKPIIATGEIFFRSPAREDDSTLP